MSSKQVIVEIGAEDEASDKIKGVAEATERMGVDMQRDFAKATDASQKFTKAIAVGTAVSAAALLAFGASAYKAYGEAEVAQKQLDHAILSVTKGTKEQLKATNDLADALEKKGVLDGDNIKMGLAQLSTFGLSNDAVQALGGSLADLAVNQFGVTASGEQLSDTANMIAKALNGQFGVLEKSGIRFTELQQKMIMTGTEMEKVKAINEGFAQNLKFTNDVAMQTGEGLRAHVGVQLGNLQEAFGKVIADGLDPMLASFSSWIDSFGGAEQAIAALIGWIDMMKPYLIIIAGMVTGALIPAFIAWGTTLMTVTIPAIIASLVALAPYIIIGGAIAAIAVLIYKAWTENWGGIQDKVIPIVKFLTETFSLFWENLKAWFTDGPAFIASAWNSMMEGIKGVASSVWEGIKNTFRSGLNYLIEKLNAFIRAYNGIAGRVPGIGGKIKIPEIPMLADGGIVTRPTLAVVGEAGPEAVIPLSRGRGGMGGQGMGGVTVVVSDNNFYGDDEDFAQKIGDKIMKSLESHLNFRTS